MILKYRARFIACLFFVLFNAQAKILKDEVISIGEEEYSFSSVCKKMLKMNAPLIEIKNISNLDCMGKIVPVYKFCDEQLADDPYYIRGYIDKIKRKVVCKKGKKVILKLTCDSPGVNCKDTELACFNLQQKYAARLKLDHHSKFKNKKVDVLNCYFSSKTSLSLPK